MQTLIWYHQMQTTKFMTIRSFWKKKNFTRIPSLKVRWGIIPK